MNSAHRLSSKPKSHFLPIITAISALSLAGCSFIPSYERPAAPVAADYHVSTNASPEAKTAADVDWKDYFTDPRLQTLLGIALGNNRDLRVSMLNVEQARAQFQIQRASQYPGVNALANATRQPDSKGNYSSMFQVGLGISAWELDFFGRIGALKEQALAQYLATEEARNSAQISLVSAVATGWLTLLADEELLDLSRRTLATREESVKLTKLRLDNGVSSEIDYRQAQSLTQSAQATYVQQQRQRQLDENALTLLLGQAIPVDILAALPSARLATMAPMQPLRAELPSTLLQRRPDIRQAEHLLIAANANIGAARAAFFPRISLTGSIGTVSSDLSGLFKSGSWAFSLAPQAVLPIFDAGRNQATLDAAHVGRDIAIAQYEKSIQTAFREVSDALAGQATLEQQVQAQRLQTEADARRLELSDLRYRNGVASYLDLLDAQRSLFATEQSLVQTRLQQLQNQISLYKVLGGGWTAQPTTQAAAS